MKAIILKFKLFIYYAIFSKLPHSRFLPFCNSIRCWYLIKVLKVMKKQQKKTTFQPNVYIGDTSRLTIGFDCQINENVFIQGARIGNYVLIAPNTAILSNSHAYTSTEMPIALQGETEHTIPEIEDGAWLGRNVIILPGVKVGKQSIVAAGAVVTKDIPPYSIAAGVPAKVIKSRLPR